MTDLYPIMKCLDKLVAERVITEEAKEAALKSISKDLAEENKREKKCK